MAGGLPELPITEALDGIRAALRAQRRAVVVAPPGAGKTTIVPLALVDEDWLDGRRIVMLEPRRLATRAAARRMAAITGTEVGDLVGHQTRDERRIGPATRIEVVTEGILTRRLQSDPELPGVGLLVFDEVHERNLPTDLGLALALDVASTIRPDLRLLAMSATPDTDALVRLLDASVIRSEGRSHPVEMNWRPPSPELGRRGSGRGRTRSRRARPTDPIDADIASTVRTALTDHDGDVLVFLPGIAEIRRVEERLRNALGSDVDVMPLAGALPAAEQDAALVRATDGRRRVVLSTDIAETSLTVEGIRIVVDSGLAREPRFDPRTGMTRLTTVTTSRASADQRAGRAGRTEPGVAYRLWSKVEHGTRSAHRTPEILQVDLAGFALELAAWGGADALDFLDEPPTGALAQARSLLADLDAIDEAGAITELGREMLTLPVHPRLARMIALERTDVSCAVATVLDERDIFRGRPDDRPADLSVRLDLIAGRHGHDQADRGAVSRVRDRIRDLARRAGITFDPSRIEPDNAGVALLLAYPDRLAARRRRGQFLLRSGNAAWLPDTDPLADEPFVVAADLDGRRDRARIRLAAAVDVDDVIARHGADVVAQSRLEWDAERDDLVRIVDRRLGAIRLGERRERPPSGEETTSALLARVRTTKLAALGWSTAAVRLRARVDFLHRTIGDPWPDWSIDALLATIDDWLAPYLIGATGRVELEQLDLTTVLRSQLPWPEGADLDVLAPDELVLPTGRGATIDYAGDAPTAAVRVQDLFGVDEHPHAAGVPVRLELLSPADRPIQVTSDLPGFWEGTWADVRKDMAGRYPKHHWPADPIAAPPRRLKDR